MKRNIMFTYLIFGALAATLVAPVHTEIFHHHHHHHHYPYHHGYHRYNYPYGPHYYGPYDYGYAGIFAPVAAAADFVGDALAPREYYYIDNAYDDSDMDDKENNEEEEL